MNDSVLDKGFGLTGNSVMRLWRYYLLSRCIPMGNTLGGPGIKPLLVFFLMSIAGRPIFWFAVRFERQMHYLHRIVLKKQ
jgi:hypothetical protein